MKSTYHNLQTNAKGFWSNNKWKGPLFLWSAGQICLKNRIYFAWKIAYFLPENSWKKQIFCLNGEGVAPQPHLICLWIKADFQWNFGVGRGLILYHYGSNPYILLGLFYDITLKTMCWIWPNIFQCHFVHKRVLYSQNLKLQHISWAVITSNSVCFKYIFKQVLLRKTSVLQRTEQLKDWALPSIQIASDFDKASQNTFQSSVLATCDYVVTRNPVNDDPRMVGVILNHHDTTIWFSLGFYCTFWHRMNCPVDASFLYNC